MLRLIANKKNLIIFILFTVALLLRLLYLIQFSHSPLFDHIIGPDTEEYDLWAKAILNGNFIWKEPGIHSPLYSYYLALLILASGGNYFIVRFIQSIIGMIAIICLFNTIYSFKGNNSFKTKFIAYAFLIAGFFFIPLIYYQCEIISESLLIPLICFGICFLYKAEKCAPVKRNIFILLSGIILGFAVITHPISIFFIFSEALYLFLSNLFRQKRNKVKFIKPFILFIFPIFLIAGSVSVYNSYLTSSLVFVQKNSGYNLYLGNNPNANGMCNVSAGPEWRKVHNEAESNADKLGISKDKYFYRQVFEFICNKPLNWIKLLGRKALLAWNYEDIYSSIDPLNVKYFTSLMKSSFYFFGMLAVIAFFGLISLFNKKKYEDIYNYRHFIILIFSIWIGLSLTVVSDRYRFLMLPGIFLFFSYGLYVFLFRKKTYKIFFINIIYLAVSITIVYAPVYKIDYSKDTAFANAMYGEAYLEAGDHNRAGKYLCETLKKYPDWIRCYINLGIIEKKNNPKKALVLFKKAYVISPGNPALLLNIALTYEQLGNMYKAEKYFKAAFDLDKKTSEIIYNYVFFLYNTRHRKDEAFKVLEQAERGNLLNSKIRNLMGVICLRENKFDKAVYYLKQAVAYSPGNLDYKFNLALAYAAEGNIAEAEKLINNILTYEPANKKALIVKGKLNKQTGGY